MARRTSGRCLVTAPASTSNMSSAASGPARNSGVRSTGTRRSHCRAPPRPRPPRGPACTSGPAPAGPLASTAPARPNAPSAAPTGSRCSAGSATGFPNTHRTRRQNWSSRTSNATPECPPARLRSPPGKGRKKTRLPPGRRVFPCPPGIIQLPAIDRCTPYTLVFFPAVVRRTPHRWRSFK